MISKRKTLKYEYSVRLQSALGFLFARAALQKGARGMMGVQQRVTVFTFFLLPNREREINDKSSCNQEERF